MKIRRFIIAIWRPALVMLLCANAVIGAHAQTLADTQSVVVAATLAGAKGLFSSAHDHVIADWVDRTDRSWSPVIIQAAATAAGARVVRPSEVLKCEGQVRHCALASDAELLRVGEPEFHADSAYIYVTLLAKTPGPMKIVLRSYQYIVARRGTAWVVVGLKDAAFS